MCGNWKKAESGRVEESSKMDREARDVALACWVDADEDDSDD